MARPGLKAVSVYVNDDQLKAMTHAASLENRSVSNFLLTLGLQKAEEMGIQVFSSAYANPADRAVVAQGAARTRRIAEG